MHFSWTTFFDMISRLQTLSSTSNKNNNTRTTNYTNVPSCVVTLVHVLRFSSSHETTNTATANSLETPPPTFPKRVGGGSIPQHSIKSCKFKFGSDRRQGLIFHPNFTPSNWGENGTVRFVTKNADSLCLVFNLIGTILEHFRWEIKKNIFLLL
jgi:hypothetical protein